MFTAVFMHLLTPPLSSFQAIDRFCKLLSCPNSLGIRPVDIKRKEARERAPGRSHCPWFGIRQQPYSRTNLCACGSKHNNGHFELCSTFLCKVYTSRRNPGWYRLTYTMGERYDVSLGNARRMIRESSAVIKFNPREFSQ